MAPNDLSTFTTQTRGDLKTQQFTNPTKAAIMKCHQVCVKDQLKKTLAIAGAGMVVLCFTVPLMTGCSADLPDPLRKLTQSAADQEKVGMIKVNNTAISEDQINAYQQIIRLSRGLGSDNKPWDVFKSENPDMANQIYREVVQTLIIHALVEQQAQAQGITVDDAQIDTMISSLKSSYPSEESWKAALSQSGYDEKSYREAVRNSYLNDALKEAVVKAPEPTQDEITQYMRIVAPQYAGKRSSHILFSHDDLETAEKVHKELEAGADFAELAQQYSLDGSGQKGGDVGWDSVHTFVSEYQDALNQLAVGEISPVISSRYGYHIIKCTDQYAPDTSADPIENPVNINDIPEDIYNSLLEMMKRQLATGAFNSYLYGLIKDAQIEFSDKSELAFEDIFGSREEVEKKSKHTLDIDEAGEAAAQAAHEDQAGVESAQEGAQASE